MKPEKLNDDDLLGILQRKESDAAHYSYGQLGADRETAMREYHRMPYGNEEDGWSQIIASDFQDSVEWVLPALLKVFTSTDKAVSFEPSTAKDVDGADQATDACNYVFYKQNSGFLILYTAIKDMLTVRNCAVHWRKETKETVSSMQFKGATQEMLAMLLQEEDAEIESATPKPMMGQDGQPVVDPMTGQPVMSYDGRLKKTEKRTICKIDAFSPEDLLIDRNWTTPLLDDCPYVARLMYVAASDLREMGMKFDEEDLEASTAAGGNADNNRMEDVNRLDGTNIDSEDTEDDSMSEGWLRIEYVLADRDGDGIAERLCVYRLEDKILSVEVCSHVPIATSSPILNTHRWDGQSFWDLVGDLQKLNTELLRQTLNNLYLTNNPRKKVLTDAQWTPLANLDDMLDSRPGGIIRQRQLDAVTDDVTPFAAAASMPMLDYVQSLRENRTGVSRTSMGLNPDSLNNTATGRQLDVSSAQQRIELVARIIAETLLKPIFKGILKVLTDGEMEKLAFRLRDKFVEYDPNEWRDSYDMSINVGLGTGDKQMQGQMLQQVWQMQQAGQQMGFVQPQQMYHTATKIIENAGFKDVENFVVDPSTLPPATPPPPPPEIQIAQMKQQADMQKLQAEQQADAQKFQAQTQAQREVEQLKAQAQLQATQATLELQAANDARDSEREQMKAAYAAQLAQQKLEFEREKLQLTESNKIYIEEMKLRGAPPAEIQAQKEERLMVQAGLQAVIDKINAPKVIIRDAQGKAIGVQHGQDVKQVIRDANGKVIGV